MFGLATRLHKTMGELSVSVTMAELAYWIAFAKLEKEGFDDDGA